MVEALIHVGSELPIFAWKKKKAIYVVKQPNLSFQKLPGSKRSLKRSDLYITQFTSA